MKKKSLFICIYLIIFFTYNIAAQEAEIDEDDQAEILFYQLEERKVISASKLPEKANLAPSTIYTISQNEINSNGYYKLQDALENIPGLTVIDSGFFIFGGQRGFVGNFSQTLILINGREMNELFSGETFISHQFATHNIKQIEVIQGPASVLYGANAFTGIINIITKTESKDWQGIEVQTEYGSDNTKAISTIFAKNTGKLRVSGSARYYTSDEWDFTDEINDRSGFTEHYQDYQVGRLDDENKYVNKSMSIPLSLRIDFTPIEKLNLYTGTEYYRTTSGKGVQDVRLDWDSAFDTRELELYYTGFDFNINKRNKINFEYKYYIERFWGRSYKFKQKIFDEHLATEDNQDGIQPEEASTGITQDHIMTEEFGSHYSQRNSRGSRRKRADITYDTKILKNLLITVGYTYDQFDILGNAYDKIDQEPYLDENTSDDNSARKPTFLYSKHSTFMQLKKPFLKILHVTLGGRYDYHSQYKGIKTFRGGLVLNPLEQTFIKVLYGQAYREATAFEQNGAVEQTGDYLDPAKNDTYELGISQGIGKSFNFSITGFRMIATDFIQPNSTVGYENANKKYISQGLENQIYFKFLKRFSGEGSYCYYQGPEVEFGEDENKKYIDGLFIHKHRISFGLNIDIFKYLRFNTRINYYSKVDAEHGYSGYGKNPYDDEDELITIPSYYKVNFTISSPINYKYDNSELTYMITVKNAFNERFYMPNPRNTGAKYYPQPGRQIVARIGIKF